VDLHNHGNRSGDVAGKIEVELKGNVVGRSVRDVGVDSVSDGQSGGEVVGGLGEGKSGEQKEGREQKASFHSGGRIDATRRELQG
jgi:hypothetical protein